MFTKTLKIIRNRHKFMEFGKIKIKQKFEKNVVKQKQNDNFEIM